MLLRAYVNLLVSHASLPGRRRAESRSRRLFEQLEDRTLLDGAPMQSMVTVGNEPSVSIAITDSGFEPATVTIVAGQSVHWTNESSGTHSVTADRGLFDSGSLLPGAGFSMAVAIPVVHTYHSATNPAFQGEVRVVLSGLSGPLDQPANSHIPDIGFPRTDPDDIAEHPAFGFLASRTQILLGFTDAATVGQANAALVEANVVILGGLSNFDILLAGAPDTPDFSGLTTAIETLRANPAVEFAAMSSEQITSAVPRPAESITFNNATGPWKWGVFTTPGDEPSGEGGNWGLEASRVPQTWNLVEEVRRRGNSFRVYTGVIDAGFETHDDLPNLDLSQLCKSLIDLGGDLVFQNKCTENTPNSHGNHVAGTIGAIYDNDSIETGRSLGVSGINPVARMHGVPAKVDSPLVDVLFAETIAAFDLALSEIVDLRVINYSMGLSAPGVRYRTGQPPNPAKWWLDHPDPNCGPGDDDDGSDLVIEFCTPNNEDEWLETMVDMGKVARRTAEYASSLGVTIVQAAGNESDIYCMNGPNASPCVSEKLRADTMAQFAWASNNWARSDLANPIVVVEAVNSNTARRPSSNVGGDIAAPGGDILSTVLNDGYGTMSGTSMAAPHVTGLIGYLLAFDPDLTITDIKNLLTNWKIPDTTGGATGRMDSFASMLAIPGAAKALVDVNDYSRDGNRRVELGPADATNPG
jgi:subtilisin family serine protease/plastocyanin